MSSEILILGAALLGGNFAQIDFSTENRQIPNPYIMKQMPRSKKRNEWQFEKNIEKRRKRNKNKKTHRK